MRELVRIVHATISDLDEALTVINVQVTPGEKLIRLIAVACRIFELLLRIHPYVNGNGHAARFCLWAILGRYNYWPTQWPIEPRPNDPHYIPLIVAYRNGNREPLERYILSNLRRTALSS